jgi:hypothetical protein
MMGALRNGQEFNGVSADDFARINKSANAIGLMALVTLIRNTDDGKLISFRLKSKFDA